MGRQARINAVKKAATATETSGHTCGHHHHEAAFRILSDEEREAAFTSRAVGVGVLETTFHCLCGREIYLTNDEPFRTCRRDDEWEGPNDPPGCGREWTILLAVREPSAR